MTIHRSGPGYENKKPMFVDSFREPTTWAEAVTMRETLVAEVLAIQSQLADMGRIGPDGGKMHPHDYHAWRRNAVIALGARQVHLGMVKRWIKEHRHLAPEAPEPAQRHIRTPDAMLLRSVDDIMVGLKVRLRLLRDYRRQNDELRAMIVELGGEPPPPIAEPDGIGVDPAD